MPISRDPPNTGAPPRPRERRPAAGPAAGGPARGQPAAEPGAARPPAGRERPLDTLAADLGAALPRAGRKRPLDTLARDLGAALPPAGAAARPRRQRTEGPAAAGAPPGLAPEPRGAGRTAPPAGLAALPDDVLAALPLDAEGLGSLALTSTALRHVAQPPTARAAALTRTALEHADDGRRRDAVVKLAKLPLPAADLMARLFAVAREGAGRSAVEAAGRWAAHWPDPGDWAAHRGEIIVLATEARDRATQLHAAMNLAQWGDPACIAVLGRLAAGPVTGDTRDAAATGEAVRQLGKLWRGAFRGRDDLALALCAAVAHGDSEVRSRGYRTMEMGPWHASFGEALAAACLSPRHTCFTAVDVLVAHAAQWSGDAAAHAAVERVVQDGSTATRGHVVAALERHHGRPWLANAAMHLALAPGLNESDVREVLSYLGNLARVDGAPQARDALQTIATTPPVDGLAARGARGWLDG